MSPDSTQTQTDIRFLLKIGMALQVLGMDAHRLETALTHLAKKLGIDADFFSTSTALMVAIHEGEGQQHYLKRTEPGDIHLERLADINEIGDQVLKGKLTTADGLKQIAALEKKKERYSAHFVNLCFGLIATTVSIFMGASVHTASAACLVGLVVGVLIIYKKKLHIVQIADAVAAFAATLMAYGLNHWRADLDPGVMLLSSILIIIPGLTLTISVTELATQNLVAGTSRMMAALMSFFKISFGVALALKIFDLVGGKTSIPSFAGYDFWVPYLGLVLCAFVLVVLFLASPKDWFWITLSCFLAFFTADLGTQILGPHLGVMTGGLTVAALSNIYTNMLHRPLLIPLMPGILVLVPGLVGFKSFNYLYEHNTVTGIDAAFQTLAMAVSLVAGIFIGNLMIKTKQNF